VSRRILFLTLAVPYPPTSGASTRNYHLLGHLAARHEVHLLTLSGVEDDDESLHRLRRVCAGVTTVRADHGDLIRKRLRQLASLPSRTPFAVATIGTRSLHTAFRDLLRTFKPSLIHVEGSPLAQLPFRCGTPLALDEHNIDYELAVRMAVAERSPVRKVFHRAEAWKLRRSETSAWREFDGVSFTSERERQVALRIAPLTPMVAIPNGVDLEYFAPQPVEREPDAIVFTGIQSYRPNSDAVQFFHSRVMPRVLAERPLAHLYVVGQQPPAEVSRLTGPKLTVTGKVADVRPYLARASVVVAPLRMGGGTRLKILEALAMGKAVVSTTVGCEGLAVRHGEHLLVADDPAEFAAHVARLCADPDLAMKLGARGRAVAIERYGWSGIAATLDRFHDELLVRRLARERTSDCHEHRREVV
jgi:sugar transferase (PEP-CTERM/EpsH1 system associated)